MFTEAQSLYLSEVLGLDPAHFVPAAADAGQARAAAPSTVVMTGELSPEESALLIKILASVRLEHYTHITRHEEVEATHVLVFGGALAPGRHQLGTSAYWSLPSLASMLGSDHGVMERKKSAWILLQQMVKELV